MTLEDVLMLGLFCSSLFSGAVVWRLWVLEKGKGL